MERTLNNIAISDIQPRQFTPTPLGSFYISGCGMYALMLATVQNVTAIQENVNKGLIPLSTAVQDINLATAQNWLNIMAAAPDLSNPSIVAEILTLENGADVPQPAANLSDQENVQILIIWMNKDPKNRSSAASTAMQALTAISNVHNTLYTQDNATLSGINNGINQASANTIEATQQYLQMYGQGPATQVQTLAQLIFSFFKG